MIPAGQWEIMQLIAFQIVATDAFAMIYYGDTERIIRARSFTLNLSLHNTISRRSLILN